MKCEIIGVHGSWADVMEAARTTIGKDGDGRDPSPKWRKRILLAEHSPIRKVVVNWKWTDIPYWVSVHFVRHKYGIEHFVSTQRTDRTGEDRTAKTQDAPVVHECVANMAEIMFISRRRLCSQAANETRDAWWMFINELEKIDPVLANCCVPECVYRGFCPEFRSCGYAATDDFKSWVARYRAVD